MKSRSELSLPVGPKRERKEGEMRKHKHTHVFMCTHIHNIGETHTLRVVPVSVVCRISAIHSTARISRTAIFLVESDFQCSEACKGKMKVGKSRLCLELADLLFTTCMGSVRLGITTNIYTWTQAIEYCLYLTHARTHTYATSV